MSERKEKSRLRGIVTTVAYFAGVIALAVGLSFLFPAESGDSNEVAAPEPSTTTTTTEPPLDVEVNAPTYAAGEEPIADAAEVILPSVVFIQTRGGIGSGVIYDADGLIMTAAHVVEGADFVNVRLASGEILEGTVVGADSVADIAIVEVDATGLDEASFYDGDLRVGQTAIAIGSPWGLDSTVTAGIVSATNQTNCEFDNCVAMVQTDAAINPGNSGGPLVDRNGDVIGINVSIFTSSGANDGVGFAVPTETAVAYAESFINGTPIEQAFIGISGQNAVGSQAGALVTEIFSGTAAEEVGMEVGDVIIRIDGVDVFGIRDVTAQMRTHRPGETVFIDVLRDGEEKSFVVTFGTRPADLS